MNQISILDDSALELVNAGEMSTHTEIVIAVAGAVSPLLGLSILIGYYAHP